MPWATIFNRRIFHELNVTEGDQIFSADHVEHDRLVGRLSGVLRDGVLTSGHSAPFGGFDFARPRETPMRVAATIDTTLSAAARAGAERVRVRCRPGPYSDNEAVVVYELLNRGFAVEQAELSYVIDLQQTPTMDTYLAGLKSPARRALRHSADLPWDFRELHEEEDWRDGHAILWENRARKGRRLSLDWPYVRRARCALPGALRMFALAHAGERCAAALIHVAAPGVWYVFAWGDARHDLPRSPMNELGRRMVGAAQAEGVRLLDLGTSSIPPADGQRLVLDDGLVQFKTSVGARPHPRLVLSR